MPDRPPLAYRLLTGGVRFVLRVFFREIAVEGRAHVPRDRGGLLVAWHPNGLIDPGLILATFPGRIVFGARDGLLRWPLLGRLFRTLGTVPIYRPTDAGAMPEEERRRASAQSLDALAGALASGAYAALFPEGHSHDRPHVAELKTGAARLYYQARALDEGGPPPVILPVGLHYDRKDLFRSDVLVTYHAPLALPPDLDRPPTPDETVAQFYDRCRHLTELIEDALVHVVHATDDWQLHTLMHRARTLLRAEAAARAGTRPDPDSVTARALGFAQIWHGYRARRASHPEEIAALREALTRYHRRLRAMKLEDTDLDRPPPRAASRSLGLLLLRAVAVYGLLPPFLLLGILVNGPVHLTIQWAARTFSSARKDAATVKILVGFVLYPLAWVVAGVLAALLLAGPPLLLALAGLAASFFSGVLVLQYTEWALSTGRAIRVRLARQRRRDVIADLRATRADLHDRFFALGEGLALPGAVTEDGRVVAG